MRVRAWIAGAACAVGAVGCGTPVALLRPPPSPPGEALAWFPERSIGVAAIGTDPDDPGVARVLGALGAITPEAVERAPDLVQLRPLLGNDLAVGVVAPGDAPLAVLVTRDGRTLAALAAARVNAGIAAHAGAYRDADLYAAEGHAFAVRGDVLLVSRTTGDLREALDRRAREEGLEPGDLPAGDHELRATLNPRALLVGIDPGLLAIPWLAAAERLDAVMDAGPDAAAFRLLVPTGAEDLVPPDVPVTGGRGARMVEVRGARLAVRDLSHVLTAMERAAGRAAPLWLVRLRPVLPAARRLAAALAGPATLVRRGRRLLLRADPSAPARMERALDDLVASLPDAGSRVRRRAGFHEAHGIRFGVRRGVFVAGEATPRQLAALARAGLARPAGARGSVAFALPEHGLTGWAAATPLRTTAEVRIRWP